jgi:hypothetical protein
MRNGRWITLAGYASRNLWADTVLAQPGVQIPGMQSYPQFTNHDESQSRCRPAGSGKAELLGIAVQPTQHLRGLTEREFGRPSGHGRRPQSGLPGLAESGQPSINRSHLHVEKAGHFVGGISIQKPGYSQLPTPFQLLARTMRSHPTA